VSFKIVKPNGKELDEFRSSVISQVLEEQEVN
jgi:hypothetical protein